METRHSFRSYDGTMLEGTLLRGERASNSIVILVHGITSSRDEFGLFSGFAEHLVQQGISSFRFDYRCHGANKQPMEYMTLSGVVNDIEAAAVYALTQTKASQIHVIGMSFGGGLSAFWAAATRNPVSSVTMLAPVIDYEEDIIGQHDFLSNGGLNQAGQLLLETQGFLETDGVRYGRALLNELRYISGIEGIQRLRCNSLIVHGDADSVVSYSSSELFVKLNPNCQLINIPDTDHGFGVEGDEDLSSPETKEKHQEVFRIVSEFIERNS
jgi:uncharacterized protein